MSNLKEVAKKSPGLFSILLRRGNWVAKRFDYDVESTLLSHIQEAASLEVLKNQAEASALICQIAKELRAINQ